MTDNVLNFVVSLEETLLSRKMGVEDLNDLIHDDFNEIGSQVQNKHDLINDLIYGDELMRTAKNFKARFIHPDVVHVSYISYTKESTFTAVKSHYRSSIWCKHHDGWQLCFHQATSAQ
jgi:hypothetical protein